VAPLRSHRRGGRRHDSYDGATVQQVVSPIGTRGQFFLLVGFDSDATVRLRDLDITFAHPTDEQLARLERGLPLPKMPGWFQRPEHAQDAPPRGVGSPADGDGF